jgi:hypothetical protein
MSGYHGSEGALLSIRDESWKANDAWKITPQKSPLT